MTVFWQMRTKRCFGAWGCAVVARAPGVDVSMVLLATRTVDRERERGWRKKEGAHRGSNDTYPTELNRGSCRSWLARPLSRPLNSPDFLNCRAEVTGNVVLCDAQCVWLRDLSESIGGSAWVSAVIRNALSVCSQSFEHSHSEILAW